MAAAAARMRLIYKQTLNINTKRSLALPNSTLVLQHLCSVQPCAARYRPRAITVIVFIHFISFTPNPRSVWLLVVRPRPRANHPTRRITTL